MSDDPSPESTETAQAPEETPSAAESIDKIEDGEQLVEEAPSTSSRFKTALGHVGKILVYGALHIPLRVIAWGAGGLFSGFAAFLFPYFLTDLLTIPEPDYQGFVWFLLPIYVIAAAMLMGTAGFARGIGRVVIFAVIKQGVAKFIMEKILDKTFELARKSEKISNAMDSGEFMLENIPLGQAEDYLKKSTKSFLEGDDLENAAGEVKGMKAKVLRWVKNYIVGIIEKYLLAAVRAETDPGGISMAKVRELGLEFAEEKIEDFIVGIMNKKTLLMAAITLLIYSVAPISFAIWHWQVSA